MWQESLSLKYTWEEGVLVEGVFVGMKCIVCSSVEGREKSIVPKMITLPSTKINVSALLMEFPMA